ncbi:MAG TPA: HlyD family secretion protein [Steroidobacteraceae bacterium]|nr:HlyD family secretion protein [Steroidobacteraceae bacterium]
MNAVVDDKPGPEPEPRRDTAKVALLEQEKERPTASRAPPPRAWRERARLPLMVGVPVLALAGAAVFYLMSGRYESTDDAYVHAAAVSISSNVSGRVSEVDVHDNQRVHRGETLFRLDDRPFRIALEEAQARLASARLQVEALKATYRQRVADLRAVQSALDYGQRELERQSRLLKSGIASQAQVDRALLARNEAQANVLADQQQITSALASLGGNPNIPVERHPMVEEAQAERDRALLNLSYTVISAPIDGVVTRVDQLQVGDYLNAATPAFALVSARDVWVEANFKEDQLGHMRVGDTARVTIDAYPDRSFRARVASVSPGTGSEFSLLPPENATGNWVKVVQRLPVRLQLEGDVPPLRAGLSADVSVDTGYRRRLFGSASTRTAALSAPTAK